MNSRVNDTHPRALRVQIELLRKMSPQRRLAMTCALTDQVMWMSKAAIRRARPGLTQAECELLFISAHYGRAIAERVRARLGREAAA